MPTPFLRLSNDTPTIRAGTLTQAEREIINYHISATIKMLEQLPWPKHLRNVPEYAGGHHERMDGKGYPRGFWRHQIGHMFPALRNPDNRTRLYFAQKIGKMGFCLVSADFGKSCHEKAPDKHQTGLFSVNKEAGAGTSIGAPLSRQIDSGAGASNDSTSA